MTLKKWRKGETKPSKEYMIVYRYRDGSMFYTQWNPDYNAMPAGEEDILCWFYLDELGELITKLIEPDIVKINVDDLNVEKKILPNNEEVNAL